MIASCLSRAGIPSAGETTMLCVSLREHNLRGIAVPCSAFMLPTPESSRPLDSGVRFGA